MKHNNTISIIVNAHMPFVRHPENKNAVEETPFFDAILKCYIPLLQLYDKLDAERIPFRVGVVLSPELCHMLSDNYLIKRFLEYTDKLIDSQARYIESIKSNSDLFSQALIHHEETIEKRFLFTGRYENNLLRVFNHYQNKGRIEILSTTATHCFLPFYVSRPAIICAQIEAAMLCYRRYFDAPPHGFWLPDLGWSPALENIIKDYNFCYSVVDLQGVFLGTPPALRGSFYPVKTPSGLFLITRDYMACKAFDDGVNLRKGALHLRADRYIKNMVSRLDEAESLMDLDPVSLLVIDVGASGGNKVISLEKILRTAEKARIQIQTPAEYICKLDAITFQTVVPEYSSSLTDGYAHELLNEQNSWIYKHVFCSQERMIDLAGRFSESGISARALNQAAREILLAQSSDWLAMVSHDSSYAMERMEYHLRNFNTIYEFMGSNHISTKWLTKLEQSDNIFPNINYRSFRRKT